MAGKKSFFRVFYGIPYTDNNYQKASESLGNLPSDFSEYISLDKKEFIIKNMKELVAQHFFLIENQKHPFWHKFYWAITCFFLAIISTIAIFLIPNFEKNILVFFIAYTTIYQIFKKGSYNYSNTLKDLVKQSVAQANGWLYDFKPNLEKAISLNSKYPSVFSGDKIVSVDDEFYGIKKVKEKKYFFKSGLYTYKIKTGSGRKKKYVTKHKHYIWITLNKKLDVEFSLTPEIANGIFNNNSKELNLESQEFNKIFKFQYRGKKSEMQYRIVKILSPAVQLGLIQLAKRNSTFKFLFTNDALVFSFDGELNKKFYTKIYSYRGVLKEDIHTIDALINEVLNLSIDITKYLD